MDIVPNLAFFLASLIWNYGLGMTYVVVPLWAHSQGLSGAEIGALFSLPAIGQLLINLVGGAYADRVGGRRIMVLSALFMACAGAGFMIAHGFWMLFLAQLVMVLSRATFWPAIWSMASRLPGARGVQMGRLNAITNFGQIAGTGSCGFILTMAGFTASFSVMIAAGICAMLLGLATPRTLRRPASSERVFQHFGPLLRMPIIYYAMMCAYVSALPFSLSMSFYPLLLEFYGFGSDASGVLIALRAVGSIGAGLLVARAVSTGPASRWPGYAGIAVACSIGALPLFPNAATVAALMLMVGMGAGVMTLYFQITITEVSSDEQRGSAMALGGAGWSVSHLTTPLVMGFLADRYGIVTGFYAIGTFTLLWVGVITMLRSRAFARTSVSSTQQASTTPLRHQ